MALSLPDTHALQNALTEHIRHPERNPAPQGIEDRRLKIYRELLYKNIEGFMSRGFPIVRQLLSDGSWHQLMRDFMHRYGCSTPYFPQLTQEFLGYLQSERIALEDEPPFLLELAHYEWVEIAVDLAEQEIADIEVNRAGHLLDEKPVVSPLAISLAYQYPVHLVGRDYQPQQAPEQATFLIVYRNREDSVKFMEGNSVTARLLALLSEPHCASGREALECLAAEMQQPNANDIVANGQITMDKLRRLDIILGTEVQ